MSSSRTPSSAAEEWMRKRVKDIKQEKMLEKEKAKRIKKSDAEAMFEREQRVKLEIKPYVNRETPLIKWMPIYSFGLDDDKNMVIHLRILGVDMNETYYLTSELNIINKNQFIQYDDVTSFFFVETQASRYILDSNSKELDPEIAISLIKKSGYQTDIDLNNYLLIKKHEDEADQDLRRLMKKFFLAGLYHKPPPDFFSQFSYERLDELHDQDLNLATPKNQIFINKIKLFYNNILFPITKGDTGMTTMFGGSRTKMKRTKSKNRKRSMRKRSKRSIKKRSKKKRH